jgi:peptidoglycan/LPS O-acetylase OafA/YrhL
MQAKLTSSTPRYVKPLTGIRALAALLVLGMHTEQNVPAGLDLLLPFFVRGYLGVDLFFVLSGFIITHVYLASLASPNRYAVQIFLWHRLIRLYPVHVTVLAGLVAVVYLAHAYDIPLNEPDQWGGSSLVWHLTLLHAWGALEKTGWNQPSWSISAEWFAYLLFPLLAPALMLVRERLAALILAMAALAAMAAVFAITNWPLINELGAPSLARLCGEFLCGAALCRAVYLGKDPARLSGDVLGGGALLTFLAGASAGLPDMALIVLLAIVIYGAATSAGPLARILGSRPLLWLGEISYSLYMVHFPVLIVIRRLWERLGFAGWGTVGQSLAFVVTVTFVIAVAAAMFYLVERPARTRLRNRMGVLAPVITSP